MRETKDSIERLRGKFPDQANFIKYFNHTNLIERYSKLNTIEKAYNSGFIKLCELIEAYQKETPRFLLEMWINQLIVFLGFKESPTEIQVRELAWLLYEELYMVNMAELTLFFTWIKKGKFGQFYNRIDPSVILIWAKEFRAERGKYICTLPDDYESPMLKKAKAEFEQKKYFLDKE